MTKLKNWLDKPWTNRTYFRWMGYSMLISFIIYLITIFNFNRKRRNLEKAEGSEGTSNSRYDDVASSDFGL